MYKSCLCKCSFLFHNYLYLLSLPMRWIVVSLIFSLHSHIPYIIKKFQKKLIEYVFFCVFSAVFEVTYRFFLVGLGLWWRSVFWSGKSYFWLVVPKKETIDAITCIQKNLCMCPCQPSFLKRWLISKHSSFCCYMLHISLWVENRIK